MMFKTVLAALLITTFGYGQMVTGVTKDDWEEINFEFNSAVLTDGFPSMLRLAELLSKNPEYRVKLDGHTDSIGSEKYNEKLSQRRAEAVKGFLEKYGARGSQMEIVPRGKRNPRTGNNTKEGRWINRRVQVTVTDKDGKIIGAGGVGDAIRAMQAQCPDYSQTLAEILKKLDKLDDIIKMLNDLKAENGKLRSDVDALKGGTSPTQAAQIAQAAKAATPDDVQRIATKAADDAVNKAHDPRFSILGMNVGADNNRHVTFSGRGRFFAPFKENFAVQAQGEYMYFKERQEAQFDLGLVNRFTKRGQAGLFSSFKHVGLEGMQSGGTLGQASATLDYIFGRGRVGFFGSKGFLDNAVVNRTMISRNVFEEAYLRIVDQAGVSTAVTLFGKTMMEANMGMLSVHGGSNKPGGTIRFIQPISNRVAVTLEGGFNETYVGNNANGRVVAGLQFGNYVQPKDYLEMDKPIPVDVPRVRYEMLTRRVRTGNDAPIADAGPDQIGAPAGVITLDGSASFDPDGDPITFQWTQVAGPAISLTGVNAAKASFTSVEGQTYSFRLTVKDSFGLASVARVTITTRVASKVVIQKFTATPNTIKSGAASTLAWQVLNADEVEISTIGKVNNQAGTAQVSPADTTTYTLTARNKDSEVSDTVTVTVERPTIRIVSFRAAPENINLGDASNLVWETENADSVSITSIGVVQVTGTTSVSPKETTTYTLTATNKFGSVNATATVTVNKPGAPKILSFSGSPLEIGQGESSTLTWEVQGATEVNISHVGSQTLKGSTSVTPSTTTTYILTAKNAGGEATASVTITVIAKPTVTFTANPMVTAKPGDPSRLTWTTSGATNVSISGIGSVALNGSVDVNPQADTTYTLTASNGKFTTTQTVTVKVTPVDVVKPPVVNVNTPDYIETLYREIEIDASGSTDPQGLPLTYKWEQVGQANNNGSAAIWSPTSPTTRIQLYGTYGDYIFRITVTNSKGASTSKDIRVRFILTRRP
ncbi:OmpA family protein [uncultured Paludibaculum sp.]|uniref:PKD domain-containing protein n=1 Tax=uncultured Paludibaculum sp. TaxID=1765020 RepID=UPI002AAB4927|nr:OmpA family protein [uncultured Paludibaculum sp.]